MIDYATWCAIRDGVASHLTAPQLAASLNLDVKTVRHWIDRPYAPRARVVRTSKLDPYMGRIVGWLDAHPLTAQQVFQRLRDAGYEGGIRIVTDYVHKIRPPPVSYTHLDVHKRQRHVRSFASCSFLLPISNPTPQPTR